MTVSKGAMAGFKRASIRLLLVLGSVGFALCAIEVAARRLDPLGISYFRDVPRYFAEAVVPAPPGPDGLPPRDSRLFQHKPGVSIDYHSFSFRTNRDGLRDRDTEGEAASREGTPTPGEGAWARERWLFLGDSVTLGWGVDDEFTWVRRIEREGRATDGRPIEALNAGHLMYETVQQADLLRVLGPRLRPDVVALCFIINDFEPTYDQILEQVQAQADAAAERAAGGPVASALFSLRQRFVALSSLLRYVREQQLDPADHRSEAGPIRFYPGNWPRNRAALDAIKAGCDALGARFVLVDHTIPEIPELEQWASENDVAWVRGGFSAQDYARGIVNSAVDSHANALGNELLAHKLLEGLRELGLLSR
jgi:hypothetical protein